MNPKAMEISDRTVRNIKDVGFPIFMTVIMTTGFGGIGSWLIYTQNQLVSSTIKANEALTRNNETATETLIDLQKTFAEQAGINRSNEKLNEKQVEILEDVQQTHVNQTEQIGQINELMLSASKLMEPAPAQREQMLKSQDETNRLLQQLVEKK